MRRSDGRREIRAGSECVFPQERLGLRPDGWLARPLLRGGAMNPFATERRRAMPSEFESDEARRALTLSDRPRNVYWEMTIACGLACRHCRAEAFASRDSRELVGTEARALVDSVAELSSMLVLTGGDPIERPDLFEVVRYARSRRVPVAITPSTTPRLSHAHIATMRDEGVSALGLSIDGATAVSHDRFRGVSGTFECAMRALGAARDVGLPVQVNTTITRANLHELPRLYDLLSKGHAPPVKRWSLFLLVPTGRGRQLELPDDSALEDLYGWFYETSQVAPFHVGTVEAPMYRRFLAERKLSEGVPPEELIRRASRYGFGIRDGNGVIFVSHRGDVYPSGFAPFLHLGNVRGTPLDEIYRTSPVLSRLRDMDALEGKCGVCEYRWLCGGSRARASSVTGRPMGEEPLCAHRSDGFRNRSLPRSPRRLRVV